MATIGFKVNPRDFTDVSNELEERNISYGIWNAEEVWFGNAEEIEITVENEEDADALREIINNIPQSANSRA